MTLELIRDLAITIAASLTAIGTGGGSMILLWRNRRRPWKALDFISDWFISRRELRQAEVDRERAITKALCLFPDLAKQVLENGDEHLLPEVDRGKSMRRLVVDTRLSIQVLTAQLVTNHESALADHVQIREEFKAADVVVINELT